MTRIYCEQNKGNRAQIKFIVTNNRVGGEYRFYVSNALAQPNRGGERETRLRHRLYNVTFVCVYDLVIYVIITRNCRYCMANLR